MIAARGGLLTACDITGHWKSILLQPGDHTLSDVECSLYFGIIMLFSVSVWHMLYAPIIHTSPVALDVRRGTPGLRERSIVKGSQIIVLYHFGLPLAVLRITYYKQWD